ncbi:fibronectin type III domain-containing protein [Halomicrobium salinisoli]|uniref:fibronectin type III domain-containing protein n=1 Tax=Halomicrobium salinisoli TaxID=2878391 RepID=UPI001CF0A97C|nr:fibronectin type III domain-containing protein [Halomicrobium salinisoli]
MHGNDSSDADGPDASNDATRDGPLSRRRFLRASAGAGALAFSLGASGSAAAADVEREACGSGGTVPVGNGAGLLINNDWSVSVGQQNTSMCVRRFADGSFGWEWERGETDACAECPNYPEVLIGTKPWSEHTDQGLFPLRRSEVDQLELDLDVEVDADPAQGEWNLALEWWLTPSQPPGPEPTHETMVVLTKSEEHTKDGAIEEAAVTDKYGNTFDYWAAPDHVDWTFHIFKTADNEVPENLDLTAIQAYVDEEIDDEFPDDHWVTGVEIGNEYWDDTQGQTRFTDFDVRLNGQVATTGTDSEFTEDSGGSVPEGPAEVTVTDVTPHEATVTWPAAAPNLDISHYVASVGDQRVEVPEGTTEATFDGLDGDTQYTASVVAVFPDGDESDTRTTTFQTPIIEPTPEPEPIDGTRPTDPDGDGLYEDINGNGEVDYSDVVEYFNNMDGETMQADARFYDYNGNGEIDFADLVDLFGEVQ